MFEKVNPAHPDKVADRIAGALVDLAYSRCENPRIAVEVLVGHDNCSVIAEIQGFNMALSDIKEIVWRIVGKKINCYSHIVWQDEKLSDIQSKGLKCADNGIFKGYPVTEEEQLLTDLAQDLYQLYPSDGKYFIHGDNLTICQSNAPMWQLKEIAPFATINPIGEWSGGISVDTGATNRKLGSDMGRVCTGGGLHGKDLTKADISANIYAHLKAQEEGQPVELSCSIGDETLSDGTPFWYAVKQARRYIYKLGGFEKFAEWGLIH